MTHALTNTFDFNDQPVRTITLDGVDWFIAADACRVLDLKPTTDGSFTRHLFKLAPDERRLIPTSLIGGFRGPTVGAVTESGLYKLIMRSDKPQARGFQDWVTRSVLPALRKDGMYVVGEEKVATGEMSDDELTLMVMTRLRAKVDRMQAERDALQSVVTIQTPKVEAFEQLTNIKRTLQDVVSRFHGVNVNATPGKLAELGYLHRLGRHGCYRPYSRYRDTMFSLKQQGSGSAIGQTKLEVLEAGVVELTKLYRNGQLPMRKGFQVAV